MMPLLLLPAISVLSAPAPAPAPDLQRLAWMAGSWRGELPEGSIEEHWSGLRGGSMFGMFRRIEQGRVKFTELLNLSVENGELIFRIRHFTGELQKAWEPADEPMCFRLVSVEGTEARFAGIGSQAGSQLRYTRRGDRLEAVLEKGQGEGARRLVLSFQLGGLQ